MFRLLGRIRPYAWGSRTGIAQVQGRVPSGGPEAELWLGAHPDDPSRVVDAGEERSLGDVITADPAGVLGPEVVDRYGPRLPFLLKLLAADRPLSLQVHPDSAQARKGFESEQAAGVPRDAVHRNYVDPYHKPELLVAVMEFDGLCGFRTAARSAEALRRLDLPELSSIVDALAGGSPRLGLRQALTGLFELSPEDGLIARVRDASARIAAEPDAPAEYALAVDLADRYPTDVGVLVSFLLNRVRLRPGEAIYMPAGNLHAYLRGVGLELMAASDNVVRGGLTPKHVDVAELLRTLRYEELPEPRVRAVPPSLAPETVAPVGTDAGELAGGSTAGEVVWWPTPMPDFRMTRATVRGGRLRLPAPVPGPRIVFCLKGHVRLTDATGEVALTGGEAVFVAASGGALTVAGDGEVYQASLGG